MLISQKQQSGARKEQSVEKSMISASADTKALIFTTVDASCPHKIINQYENHSGKGAILDCSLNIDKLDKLTLSTSTITTMPAENMMKLYLLEEIKN